MGIEEIDVILFLAPIQTPEITGILIARSFLGAADHAEMEVERTGRRHSHFVPEKKVHNFVQRELFAAAIALAFAGRQLTPLGGKTIAVLILGFQQASILEANAEAAFARMITAIRAAQSIRDVVVNFAVVKDGAFPVEMQTPFIALPADVLRELIAAIEPGRGVIH